MPFRTREQHIKGNHRYYANHQSKCVEANRNCRAKLFAFITEFKESKPCVDCGNWFPGQVMEFDHVRGTKVDSISRIVSGGCKLKLWKELPKCDLVCANCHRIRTVNRRKCAR